MNRTTIIAVTCLLLLGTAGFVTAADPGDKTEWTDGTERYPDCEPGQDAVATDKGPVSIDGDIEVLGEDTAYFCTGEQWDGQDPNTRRSDANAADEDDGTVYVNPLGDCSGWDNSDGAGCEGGVDRPTVTTPVHVRVTGDTAGDDVSAYVNEETFAVGRSATAVSYDTSSGDGYVAVYLEDHTDQVVPQSIGPDGNILAMIVDYVQGGVVTEDDCTQSQYEQGGTNCGRDNTAATVEFHTGWATGSGQTADTGALLP